MANCEIDRLEQLNKLDVRKFWVLFEWALRNDDGRAATEHLVAARPIYYCDDSFDDEMVRKWPDGRKELVSITNDGEVSNVRKWPL
jgi:hypothetical protein